VSICLVATLTFLVGYRFVEDKSLAIPIVIMAALLIHTAFVLFNEKVYSFYCLVFNGFPKIKKSLMDMHYDIALMHNKRMEGVKAIILSCIGQVLLATSYYFVALGLHQEIAFMYFLRIA